ncbi:hypothetical protein QAD02_014258 [Eretmocerus hayati]|uniref:Uncharacterized protein n=1 Tax=Eretmocerus hayati TaxID=131215 RepID=A0ACC2P4U2_9HYME|nr:hypothetical protein QAD02_014258 [Eretmocerus hayati]
MWYTVGPVQGFTLSRGSASVDLDGEVKRLAYLAPEMQGDVFLAEPAPGDFGVTTMAPVSKVDRPDHGDVLIVFLHVADPTRLHDSVVLGAHIHVTDADEAVVGHPATYHEVRRLNRGSYYQQAQHHGRRDPSSW